MKLTNIDDVIKRHFDDSFINYALATTSNGNFLPIQKTYIEKAITVLYKKAKLKVPRFIYAQSPLGSLYQYVSLSAAMATDYTDIII